MAKDKFEFVISDDTAKNLAKELVEISKYKDDGWSICDLRIESCNHDGVQFKVGVIEVEK